MPLQPFRSHKTKYAGHGHHLIFCYVPSFILCTRKVDKDVIHIDIKNFSILDCSNKPKFSDSNPGLGSTARLRAFRFWNRDLSLTLLDGYPLPPFKSWLNQSDINARALKSDIRGLYSFCLASSIIFHVRSCLNSCRPSNFEPSYEYCMQIHIRNRFFW